MKWLISIVGLSACTGVLSDPTPDPQQDREPARYVFATRVVYGGGEVHGLDGADEICTYAAQSVGLIRSALRTGELGPPYRAWLSSVDETVLDRFTAWELPYKLLDGTVVASRWDDLVDGTLAHAIDRDEHNQAIATSDTAGVWTYTFLDGTTPPWEPGDPTGHPRLDCQAWTTGLALGSPGDLHERGSQWSTASYGLDCSIPRHLYCFEQ